MATRSELVEVAQDKLKEVIRILNIACENDGNAKAYVIDHLKIMASRNHGFLSNDLNLDKLIERYENDDEDIGHDDIVYGEDYEED